MGLRDNIAAARRAGHSEEDINARLRERFSSRVEAARTKKFDSDTIRKSLKAGEVPDIVINDLLGPATPAAQAGPSKISKTGERIRAGVRRVGEATRTATQPFRAGLDRLRQAGALSERIRETEIPGAARARAALEAGPEFGGEIARMAAERGEPFPAVQGAIAGAPTTLASALLPIPTTVGEAAGTAATVAAFPAARTLGPRALPILGRPVGAVLRRARQRIFGARPGEPLETFADAVPPPRGPGLRPRQAPEAAPEPAAPAQRQLPGPAERARLGVEEPVRGEGFELVPPRPRTLFEPRAGELTEVVGLEGQTLPALRRAMGLEPAAPGLPKPKPPKGTAATPRAKPRSTLTKKRATKLLKDRESLRTEAGVQELVELKDAGKISGKQLDRVTSLLTSRFINLAEGFGMGDPRTAQAQQAMEAFGLTPPRVRAAEVPISQPSRPATSVNQPAGAGRDPALEQTVDVRAIEQRAGKRIFEMTKEEFKSLEPDADPEIHLESIRKAIRDRKRLPEPVEAENVDLIEDFERDLRAADEREITAAVGPQTPLLEFARRKGLNLDSIRRARLEGDLENIKGRGIFRKQGGMGLSEFAEAAWQEGLIAENSDGLAIEGLNTEATTGRTPFGVRAPEGMIPEVSTPGQEGSIFPRPQEAVPRSQDTPTLDALDPLQKAAPPKRSVMERLKDAADRLKESQLDYLAPLERLVGRAEQAQGKPFSHRDNAYIQGTLFPGVRGIIEERIMRFDAITRPVARRGLETDLDKFLTLRQFSKRIRDLRTRAGKLAASAGPAEAKEAAQILNRIQQNEVNPRGFNEAKVQQGLAELQQRLGPLRMQYIESKAGELWDLYRGILIEARDSGLISAQSFDAIAARGIEYSPIEVLDFADAGLGGGGARTLSTAFQDVVRRMEGTTREVRGALPAGYNKIGRSLMNIERNKVAQKVAALSQVPGFETTVFKVRPFTPVPEGFEPFYVYEDGVRQVYAVPKDVGIALNGMGRKEIGLIQRMLRLTAQPLRAGATSLNLEFALPNFLRDVRDFALLSRAGLRARNLKEFATLPLQAAQLGVDLLRGFFSVLGKDETYIKVLKSRALFSTIQKEITPESFIQSLKKDSLERSALSKVAGLIPKIINLLEETPKTASFVRMIRAGASVDEAAFETRRFGGSPDFNRRGAYSPDVNLIWMFYQARLNGTARVVEALQRDPKELGAKLIALVGIPALTTYLWNKQFDEYDKLPEFERFNKNIIMLGFNYKTRDGQVVPARVTVSKTELEKAIGGTMEGILDRYFETEGRDGLQRALNVVTSFAPINIEIDPKKPTRSFASSIASGLNPLFKAPIEFFAPQGYDTFRQRPLETQGMLMREPFARFKPSTSETAKALGRIGTRRDQPGGPLRGGTSPVRIQQGVESIAAGVGRQALDVSDALLRAAGKAPPREFASTSERVANLPIVRRFVGRFEPRSDVEEKTREFKVQRQSDRSTASFLATRAVGEFIASPTTSNRQAMNAALREAAKIDPDIPARAQKRAVEKLSRRSLSRAFDVFNEMTEADQAAFLRELGQSEEGLQLRARLFQEFRKRRGK